MNSDVPKKAIIYIAFLSIAGAAIIFHAISIMDWSQISWFPVLVFLSLIILADSFPVTLPRGGSVAVSFAAIAASILLFQPFIVIMIIVARDLYLLFSGKNFVKHFFNVSQVTVSIGSSALIYQTLASPMVDFSFAHIPAFIISMVVFVMLNTLFVTLIIAYVEDENPYTIWLVNIKWSTLNFASMAPLGALIAVIFINIGFWGLVLFLLPLILARHSFQSYMDMRQTFMDTIKSLSLAIDAKDPYTKGHSARVAEYAVSLAHELKWPEDKVEFLQYITLIHDVGKVAVPDSILKKDGLLTNQEYDIMKTHSTAGSEVIKDVKFFTTGSDIIKHHHERWDGTGYPDQLKGKDIPEGARIIAVADAFDAMTSDRPYRRALGHSLALNELKSCAGTQFDPKVVDAFIRIIPQLKIDTVVQSQIDIKIDQQPLRTEAYH